MPLRRSSSSKSWRVRKTRLGRASRDLLCIDELTRQINRLVKRAENGWNDDLNLELEQALYELRFQRDDGALLESLHRSYITLPSILTELQDMEREYAGTLDTSDSTSLPRLPREVPPSVRHEEQEQIAGQNYAVTE